MLRIAPAMACGVEMTDLMGGLACGPANHRGYRQLPSGIAWLPICTRPQALVSTLKFATGQGLPANGGKELVQVPGQGVESDI